MAVIVLFKDLFITAEFLLLSANFILMFPFYSQITVLKNTCSRKPVLLLSVLCNILVQDNISISLCWNIHIPIPLVT